MYNQTRDEEVVLLKKMWLGEAVICPKCGKEQLVHLIRRPRKAIVIGSAQPAVRSIERSIC